MNYLLDPIDFTKNIYEEFYEQSALEISNYKFMSTMQLINDLLECII
jgi:hypothetical protein